MNKEEAVNWIKNFLKLITDEEPQIEVKELLVKVGEQDLKKGWTAIVSFENRRTCAFLIGKKGKTARQLDKIVDYLSRFRGTFIKLFIAP